MCQNENQCVSTKKLMLCNSEEKKKNETLAQKCKKVTNKTSKQTSKRRKNKVESKTSKKMEKNKHKNITVRQDGRWE